MRIVPLLAAAALGLLAAVPAAAYSPGRAREIPLTDLVVRKVVACYRAAERAESRATGGISEVYRNRQRLRDAALARCGFPKAVSWRNAVHSVRAAFHGGGGLQSAPDFRASNQDIVLRYERELERLFAE